MVQENTNSPSEIKEEFYSERLSQLVDKGCNTSLVTQPTTETRRIEIDLQPVVKKRNVDSRKEKENSQPKKKPQSKERKKERSKSGPKPVKKKQKEVKDVKSIAPMPTT